MMVLIATITKLSCCLPSYKDSHKFKTSRKKGEETYISGIIEIRKDDWVKNDVMNYQEVICVVLKQ